MAGKIHRSNVTPAERKAAEKLAAILGNAGIQTINDALNLHGLSMHLQIVPLPEEEAK